MQHEQVDSHSAWLGSVFEAFEGPLVCYAVRLVGDVERGRDVVQDVFLRLCLEGPGRGRDHVAAWLYRVCRNRALDICKKERRMGAISPGAAEIVLTTAADPAVAAELDDEASLARALLGRLPDNQQEVIRLKVEHGLKYREISEVTGLSVSNVGYLLHEGLQALRRQLAPDGSE
jgi:RNA polymerase sigma-70 factor (ECF subfamily)